MRIGLVGVAAMGAASFLPSCDSGANTQPTPRGGQCDSNLVSVGRAPLRRLTRIQFNNALQNLFPSAQIPTLNLPNETLARGFENNADVQTPSVAFVEAYHQAVRQAVALVMQKPENVAPCLVGAGDEKQCGQTLVRDFGRRAFRRPLSSEEASRYQSLFAQGLAAENGVHVGASMILEAMLQAPQFLYVPEFGTSNAVDNHGDIPLSAHELATRLSLFLWDDLPDEELAAAADSGALLNLATLQIQAERMLRTPRARNAVRNFHRQWLDLGRIDRVMKDPATFPMWNDALKTSMQEENLAFVEEVIFDGPGTLEALLTSTNTRVDAALADIYGIDPPASGWKNVSLEPTERAGLLTMPAFLAAHGHAVQPSPVLRGVFILDRLLCAPPPAPPPGVQTDTNPMDPGGSPKTNRAKYEAHIQDPVCASCHVFIDGAGFPFEQFDSIGRFQTLENGLAIDTSGELFAIDVAGPVSDAVDLAHRLASSEDVRRCVTKQWFRYAFGRVEEQQDMCTINVIDDAFAASGTNLRQLILAIVTSPAFTHRPGGSGT